LKKGNFKEAEIIVLLGENGTGKTTFLKIFAGIINGDNIKKQDRYNISYKPQKFLPRFKGLVETIFEKKLSHTWGNNEYLEDVIKPLGIQNLLKRQVNQLSSGEMQKLAIALTLSKPADIYLFDEPFSYLDIESKLKVSLVIKNFIKKTKKTSFVVEHDLTMALYMANRLIIFEKK